MCTIAICGLSLQDYCLVNLVMTRIFFVLHSGSKADKLFVTKRNFSNSYLFQMLTCSAKPLFNRAYFASASLSFKLFTKFYIYKN